MRTSLFSEFKESTALARTDAAWTTQLLRHYQTSTLLAAWGDQQRRCSTAHAVRVGRGAALKSNASGTSRAAMVSTPAVKTMATSVCCSFRLVRHKVRAPI